GTWEVIVVDNNSADATRRVVVDAAANFPVELRYLLERQVGAALLLMLGSRLLQEKSLLLPMMTCGSSRIGCSRPPKRWSASSAILWEARLCRFGAGPSPRGSPTREGGTGL